MQRLGGSFGGQGARRGLASPYSAPQMPPRPMSETRPRPINGSISLSDACLSFQVYGGSSPIITPWLGVDGMREGGCCPGNPPPFASLPILCPRPGLQWLRKQGQRWHFPRTVVQGFLFSLQMGLGAGGDPFLQPQYLPLPGALSWGPVAHRVLQRAVFPREMAD